MLKIIRLLILGAAIFPMATGAGAQVYKWVDKDGSVHYGNNPYTARQPTAKPPVAKETPKSPPPAEKKVAEPAAEPDKTTGADETLPENESGKKTGLHINGKFEITESPTGYAVITVPIKNGFKYPVDGIRLDVILFTKDKTRLDFEIPFTGGQKKSNPAMLKSGETGVIQRETELKPEQLAGHRYRLVWAYKELVDAPKPGEKPAENVEEKVIKPELPENTEFAPLPDKSDKKESGGEKAPAKEKTSKEKSPKEKSSKEPAPQSPQSVPEL